MTVGPSGASQPPPAPPESADLFDYALIFDYLKFFAKSVRRHKLFCAGIFFAVVFAACFMMWALPKTYHVETKLLAQRNQVIAALGNPGRNMPWDADMPTRAATETILRHDNLVSLVRQTNLVSKWAETRSPAQKVKDALVKLFHRGSAADEEEMVAMMVGTLETRLTVTTGEGTVLIGIDWPHAQTAYLLVDAAQRNFLEARHVAEVSTISEAVSILEGRAAALRDEIEADVENVEAARKELDKRRPVAAAPRQEPASEQPKVDEALTQLRELVETKKRAIADLEEFHRRQLSELQVKLADARQNYSDAHPVVVDLQQRVDALQNQPESLQLTTLRGDLAALEKEAIRKGAIDARGAAAPPTKSRRQLSVAAQQLARATTAEIEEAPIEQAKGDLRFALSKYNTILDRIDSARMELESARAAFKYRYSVIAPAEVPRAPVKPKAAKVLGGAMVAGFFLAIFLAGALDLRRGLVLERWQVERKLELDILAEVGTF